MKTYLNNTRGLTKEQVAGILKWGQKLLNTGIEEVTSFGPVAKKMWFVEPYGYIGRRRKK